MSDKFIEIVIEGPYATVKALVTGYLLGQGKKEGYYFSRDCRIKRETIADRVKEWAGMFTTHTYVIVEEGLSPLVEKAIKSAKKDMEFKICAENHVKGASFKFYYHAFTKDDGQELRKYFDNLSKPLELKEYEPVEEVHDDAKSTEGYAPLHNYELKAGGTVEGPFLEVLSAYKNARNFPLASVENMRLQLKEIK